MVRVGLLQYVIIPFFGNQKVSDLSVEWKIQMIGNNTVNSTAISTVGLKGKYIVTFRVSMPSVLMSNMSKNAIVIYILCTIFHKHVTKTGNVFVDSQLVLVILGHLFTSFLNQRP